MRPHLSTAKGTVHQAEPNSLHPQPSTERKNTRKTLGHQIQTIRHKNPSNRKSPFGLNKQSANLSTIPTLTHNHPVPHQQLNPQIKEDSSYIQPVCQSDTSSYFLRKKRDEQSIHSIFHTHSKH